MNIPQKLVVILWMLSTAFVGLAVALVSNTEKGMPSAAGVGLFLELCVTLFFFGAWSLFWKRNA